jgi:lipoxygenase
VGVIYVPRDEEFTVRKAGAFLTKKVTSTLSAFTMAQAVAGDRRRSFPSLAAIDALYEDGYKNMPGQQPDNLER